MPHRHITFFHIGVIVILVCVGLFSITIGSSSIYKPSAMAKIASSQNGLSLDSDTPAVMEELTQHISTPENVRGIYMTAWVSGTSNLRNKVIDLIDTSPGINAVIIDIKDDTGKISFQIDNPLIEQYGSTTNKISDIQNLIKILHDKNIYVIGRIAVFQDTFLAPQLPQFAVQKSDGSVWRDRKKLAWFDAGSHEVWDYVATIAEESYEIGFDEINLDYVRFPSDGDVKSMKFPISEGKEYSSVLGDFFSYMSSRLRFEKKIPLSADVFGMTTTNHDDLGIGQVLENIVPYVDYIAPMIYPSHYPATFHGYSKPAEVPYEIITIATKGAIKRLQAMEEPVSKLRPWLQDFNLGATYDVTKVNAQMKALADLGIASWMMWDPSNTYTTDAYYTTLDNINSSIQSVPILYVKPEPTTQPTQTESVDTNNNGTQSVIQ